MKIRTSSSETLTCKVYLYENKKEQYFVVSIPDLFWSIQFDDEIYGEALTEMLTMHLFNVVDEDEANLIALRITQWLQEM